MRLDYELNEIKYVKCLAPGLAYKCSKFYCNLKEVLFFIYCKCYFMLLSTITVDALKYLNSKILAILALAQVDTLFSLLFFSLSRVHARDSCT